MRKVASLAFLVLIAACGPTPTALPVASPLASMASTGNSIPNTATPQAMAPSAPAQPGVTLISTPATSASLWLQVVSPQDEAVVDSPQVDLLGSAPAGAVISVNDNILIVGADRQFQTTVPLEEGPNVIEVVASDENGNETSIILTVSYEP